MQHEEGKGYEFTDKELDMAHAVATWRAGRAGAFGDREMTTEDAGTVGAAFRDMQEVSVKYVTGQIDAEQAKEEVSTIAKSAFRTWVEKVVHTGVEAVAAFVSAKVPILAVPVQAARSWVKEKVVDVVMETGKKVWNWAKSLFS